MLSAMLTVGPWELEHDDLAGAFDRLHGTVGITGLSLRVATAPQLQLVAHAYEHQTFRTRGGLFYHADPDRYSSTRCKPIMSAWLKRKDPLERIGEACTQSGLSLRAVVSASLTGRIAAKHPDMACKNCFGDVSSESVCLANPDVRAYLAALVADVSARPAVTALVMADLQIAWSEAHDHDLRAGPALGAVERDMLAMCFCESCQQQAGSLGVDMEAARDTAKRLTTVSLQRGAPCDQPLDAVLADQAPLTLLREWRTQTLTKLVDELVSACSGELILLRRAHHDRALDDFAAFADRAAAVITSVEEIETIRGAMCPSARRNEVQLPGWLTCAPHNAELVRGLSQAVESGFNGIDIDGYGLVGDSGLAAIRQAIRYARRSAND